MKINKLIRKIAFLLTVLMAFNACSKPKNTRDYLRKVLNNLQKIESATYNTTKEGWASGDTAASVRMNEFIKEYDNPLDSTIGAGFVSLLQNDTGRMTFCYDGKMRALVYEDEKSIVIDRFSETTRPYRPLSPPFFNYTKNILQYALGTKDSITIKIEELKESVCFCLTIFEDKQVEFFGKACYMDKNPYDYGETTSKYEIWINKSTDLPFKVRREMSHDISVQTVSNVNFNKIKLQDFNASDYFRSDYTLHNYGEEQQNRSTNYLVGKKAPVWNLKNVNDESLSLNELKSKVVIIQFTSVSCGPCRASIPFIRELATAYKKSDFDFVAVECTSKSLNALKQYHNKNAINYNFLQSNKDVRADYAIRSFPVFFVLDKNRVVRKVINGYGKGSTDKEITDAIDELIKKI